MEIWKDVIGYEGLYKISNLGRVKSFVRCTEGKILNILFDKKGYPKSHLTKDGKTKYVNIHRLVAKAFITNTENKPCINHIDGNKENNSVDNLEWSTYSENNKHAYDNGLRRKTKIKIEQYSLDGKFIKEWDSALDVQNELKIAKSNIASVCKGKRKTTGGYIWKYKN